MAGESNSWIDVSVPLTSGMAHWPGEPAPNFELISDKEHGADANVTMCRMVAHTGTHMDAPHHFLQEGKGIDTFPLEFGVGPARVIEALDVDIVTHKELESKGIQRGDRVLVKTRNSQLQWTALDFQENYVGIDSSAATFLVEVGAVMVGVDYLSVGVYHGDNPETHRILLSGGVWIVEGLALGHVSAGTYEMICLPLRIVGCDGSPVRAILRAA
ncbi:MAG TPA: cyclase family protein [Bryobacteraceae bacterium]|nr:cyclase family protein [Bryobacteraceae bacterium]